MVATDSNVSEMVITDDATMASDTTLPASGSADSKTALLRKLHATMHFEKTVTALSSMNGHEKKSKMGLPAWFVHKYGDKFQKSVILRSESSTKAWPVRLTISIISRRGRQVVFSGGWKAFATFHGLLEGDSLVFALTAMSVFEVYIFPGTPKPKRCPSQAPRKMSNEIIEVFSRKKAAEQFQERRVQEHNWDATEITEGLMDHSNDLHLLESENLLECSSNDSYDRQQHAFSQETLKASGVTADALAQHTGERNITSIEHQDLALQTITRNVSQFPVFFKKLAVINIYNSHEKAGEKTACIEIPLEFVTTHGNRLHSYIKLQGIREESEKRAVACLPCENAGKEARLYLRAGWRDFVHENDLKVGQVLFFALTADSFFIVREVASSSTEGVVGPNSTTTGRSKL